MKKHRTLASSLELSNAVRRDVLRMTHRARKSHVGSSLCCVDILAVLYHSIAKVDPLNPKAEDRDRVIISKGHCAAAVYATLANSGFIPVSMLKEYCTDGSPLIGHVTVGVPGVEFSTGSLGHGLPFAVGSAIAASRDDSDRRTFVLLSDGEIDEGSNWESALLGAHHDLRALTVIIDRNGLQSLTTTENTLALEPLVAKWEAFGGNVVTIDGHSHDELEQSLASTAAMPTCIIAKTIKGKGVEFMENQVLWHYQSPSDEDLAKAIRSLESEGQ